MNHPNSLRFCDQRGGYQNLGRFSGVPYRNEFMSQNNVPIEWGFEANASLYSDPVFTPPPQQLTVFNGRQQGFRTMNWSITPSTRYPLDCNCPNPGALVDPVLTQRSVVIQLIPAVLVENQTLGVSVKPYLEGGSGGKPSVIRNPRMIRLNLQFKF